LEKKKEKKMSLLFFFTFVLVAEEVRKIEVEGFDDFAKEDNPTL